jgi:hypothetical protein
VSSLELAQLTTIVTGLDHPEGIAFGPRSTTTGRCGCLIRAPNPSPFLTAGFCAFPRAAATRLPRVPPEGGAAQLLLDDPVGIYLIMATNVAHFGDQLQRLAIASLGGYTINELPARVAGSPLRRP